MRLLAFNARRPPTNRAIMWSRICSPGLYTMTAEAAGFKKFESFSNKLDANSTLSIDADADGWRGDAIPWKWSPSRRRCKPNRRPSKN